MKFPRANSILTQIPMAIALYSAHSAIVITDVIYAHLTIPWIRWSVLAGIGIGAVWVI